MMQTQCTSNRIKCQTPTGPHWAKVIEQKGKALFVKDGPRSTRLVFHPQVIKPVLAIDWNSTLQDQIGFICHLTKGLLARADFAQWDPPLGCKCGMTEPGFADWAWRSPLIQWRAPAYPGAWEAINRLRERYQIWIVTLTSNPQLVAPWLDREGIAYDKIVVTQDKAGVEWDALIDDNPATLETLHEAGRRVIRYALPWNAHLSHIPAICGWEGLRELPGEIVYFLPGYKIPLAAFKSDGK